MIKVTYLEHSGYVTEYKNHVMIFDWYKGTLPEISADKKVYVFSSHAHDDHFQKAIFEWKKEYPDITYILSDDITEEGPGEKTYYIGPYKTFQPEPAMEISTLKSTDEGVAFLVRIEDKVFYHAGDLNWWHWEGEDLSWNKLMQRDYQSEIGRLEGQTIDVAFVPLDMRLGEQYYWGMDYFMRHTDTKWVFPMHMCGYEAVDKLMENPESKNYREKVKHVTGPQQIFEIEDEIEENGSCL